MPQDRGAAEALGREDAVANIFVAKLRRPMPSPQPMVNRHLLHAGIGLVACALVFLVAALSQDRHREGSQRICIAVHQDDDQGAGRPLFLDGEAEIQHVVAPSLARQPGEADEEVATELVPLLGI